MAALDYETVGNDLFFNLSLVVVVKKGVHSLENLILRGNSMQQLHNKTVLVTGASRGIGHSIASVLHRDGANVIIHAGSNLDQANHLAQSLGDRCMVFQADFFDSTAIDRLWFNAVGWTGTIDVLVNNAGVFASSKIEDDDDWVNGWKTNLTINLVAAATLCRLAIQHFRNGNGGTIINIASRSAHQGDDSKHLAYGATKGGLLALTKGIARGFANEGILAYALAPGWVRTNMAEDYISEVGEEKICETLPMREITPPSEIGEIVSFLASGRARHATGCTIDITGADYVR